MNYMSGVHRNRKDPCWEKIRETVLERKKERKWSCKMLKGL